MQITFWLSAQERDEALFDNSEVDSSGTKKILAFRRNSPRSQDHNEQIKSAGDVRNGSEGRT